VVLKTSDMLVDVNVKVAQVEAVGHVIGQLVEVQLCVVVLVTGTV